jgi:predicted kinase
MVGYPGAGKTTVARWITERTGAVHLWADVERNKLFENPSHSEAESSQLYKQLNEHTEELLTAGKSVIFDTNFNHYSDRELLREIAARHHAKVIIIWVATPVDIARERAVHSQIVRNGYDFTMSPEQFDAIAAKLEPPRPEENAVKLDGTQLDRETVLNLVNN